MFRLYIIMMALVMMTGCGSSPLSEREEIAGTASSDDQGDETTEATEEDTTESTLRREEEEEEEEEETHTSQQEVSLNLPSCNNGTDLFSVSPLDEEDYLSITPLGSLNPSGHTFPTVHTYMMLADKSQEAPISAPADMTITSVSSYLMEATGKTDYSVTFYPCAEVRGYFDHVTTLTDELEGAIGELTNCNRYNPGDGWTTQCSKDVEIEVNAGDLIGYAGGPLSTGSAALDFGARDERIDPLVYVNVDRLVNDDQVYVVCPYDYYDDEAYDVFADRLEMSRTQAPICGTVELDVASTAQGRWYLEGSSWSTSEADHVALVPSNFDPSVGVLSVGNSSIGTAAYHFDAVAIGQVNRRFTDVTADGKVYCYDQLRNRADAQNSQPISGYLFLKMTDNETLHLERSPSGACPANPDNLSFSSNMVTFER